MFIDTAKNKIQHKGILVKLLYFLVTVSTIVYFLPREGKFNYQYDLNKPWKYGLIQAPFDFPILKEDSELKKEQDSILALFQPYYQLNLNKSDSLIETFYDNALNRIYNESLNQSTLEKIKNKLYQIYQEGVISETDLFHLRSKEIQYIRVIKNRESYSKAVNHLFTQRTALETLQEINKKEIIDSEIIQLYQLKKFISPNLNYDKTKSKTIKEKLINSLPIGIGMVQSGQKIIDRGEIINNYTYRVLNSLRKKYEKEKAGTFELHTLLSGQILFTAIFILAFMLYIEKFKPDYYKKKKSLVLPFSLIILYNIIASLMMSSLFLHVYILPFAMMSIIIRIFLDSRTAFMASLIAILLVSISLHHPFEFILLQTTACLVAILSLRELSQRSQLIRTAVLVLLSYGLLNFALELIAYTNFDAIEFRNYIYFFINGIILLFTYPFLFILEKIFGFTSNVTLVELSNINNKLLQQLSEEAPGTFQHSMQVANLAAAAANKIGANSQLVRTGALYHDIGKLSTPAFFTENQNGQNPHQQLEYTQSAQIIINHIQEGLKLADKYNLPKVIKDFISTHQGKGLAKYFYISYKNEHPNIEIDEKLFRYPGPNPFSKETAILMMADAVEATSRSLTEYTEKNIKELVNRIIDEQVQEGYFNNCPITFQEIKQIKSLFVEKLMISFHTRISYPELKQKAD